MASGMRSAVCLLCAILLAGGSGAIAVESEEAVKAAFVYNFPKFVEWPDSAFPSADAAIEICVLGGNGFAEVLKNTVRDKTVKGRPLAVRENVPLGELGSCRILYISSSEQRHLSEVLEHVGTLPVLTVGDADALAERGGIIIGLTTNENRVHFEVNVGAARRAGLKLGSQLLKVATRVVGGDQAP
jgi:hypothetical protein